MIDRLPETTTVKTAGTRASLEDVVLNERVKTKKAMKTFMNNAGILVGVFIVFAVIVIVTTDIHFVTFEDVSSLGLNFFLLLICSYSMHVACSDSGMRAGMTSKTYLAAVDEYEKQKKIFIEKGMQGGLYDFCQDYVAQELKNARVGLLLVAGITYDNYVKTWASVSEADIKKAPQLSAIQKKALIKANRLKPINLSPEHIIRKGRNEGNRAPLGMTPQARKKAHFGTKFFSTLIVSGGIACIALEVVKNPTWAIFASVTLKLLSIVFNGFDGYKFGYENIVISTSDYINDQTDLLKQAIRFLESPIEKVCQEANQDLPKSEHEAASITPP